MRILLSILLIGVLFSCSEDRTVEGLKANITAKEDALKNLAVDTTTLNERDTLRIELVEALVDFYNEFPENDYAPECLDKVHLVYSAMRKYSAAAHYGDILLKEYPDYINREMVLESQFNTYDMFLKPRDKEKAKYYLELRLKENPNMDKGLKEEIEYRLKYIDLTIEQIMEMQMQELK